jgi:hypothetical protein
MAAERLIYVLLAENYKLVTFGKPVRMIRRASAFHADGMNFLHVFSNGHKSRHRTEWLAHVVGVEAGNDYADASVRECLNDLHERIVEELGLIYTYDFDIA